MILAVPLYVAQTETRIMIWLLKSTSLSKFHLLSFSLPSSLFNSISSCVYFYLVHLLAFTSFYYYFSLFSAALSAAQNLWIFFYDTIMIAL